MPRRRSPADPVDQVLTVFRGSPSGAFGVALLICIAVVLALIVGPGPSPTTPEATPTQPPTPPPVATAPVDAAGYLFCFWNVENLFDDQADGRGQSPDKEFDLWFAHDPVVLETKLQRLCDVLLRLNGGRGPDILALCEVEGPRSAELLADRLNRRLNGAAAPFRQVLCKEIKNAGRHIAPAILTRLGAVRDRTRLLGSRQRILECHLEAGGRELVVVASHWTSRRTDKDGSARSRYADTIYGAFRAMHTRNPQIDYLVCGDFNDDPSDPSVREHLHAVGRSEEEVSRVRSAGPVPWLLNLSPVAGGSSGTLSYRNHWHVFDQVAVSPGMLDATGWACDPASFTIANESPPTDPRTRRPWNFGDPADKKPLANRGYSDHLPVTVRVRVGG